MEKAFSFPTYKQLQPYDRRRLKRMRSFIRYYVYRLWCLSECKVFEDYLNQNSFWIPLFSEHFYRCNTLLDRYCDKRFSKKKRLEVITINLSLADKKFGKVLLQSLIKEHNLLITKVTDNLNLYLNINEIDPFEGFFSISIKNQHNERVYNATFTFLEPNLILITSIQGAKKGALEIIKEATKELHGIRPMFMLVDIFRIIANVLNCQILGIQHKYQAKYRWNDHEKLLFNYDEFWQENNAILNSDGYWQIPMSVERKSLESVASKKRSMYRKRYAMLDMLSSKVEAFFKDKVDE